MLTFRVAETRYEHGWCVLIRTLAFVVEQNVDIFLEIDEFEDECRHILGFEGDKPYATARWRVYKPGIIKIERVAILKQWRGKGLGHTLMLAVMENALRTVAHCKTFYVEAQDYAIPFYEKLGFTMVGDGFLDANILHHAMEKPVGAI